jgi:hypothetical protein
MQECRRRAPYLLGWQCIQRLELLEGCHHLAQRSLFLCLLAQGANRTPCDRRPCNSPLCLPSPRRLRRGATLPLPSTAVNGSDHGSCRCARRV